MAGPNVLPLGCHAFPLVGPAQSAPVGAIPSFVEWGKWVRPRQQITGPKKKYFLHWPLHAFEDPFLPKSPFSFFCDLISKTPLTVCLLTSFLVLDPHAILFLVSSRQVWHSRVGVSFRVSFLFFSCAFFPPHLGMRNMLSLMNFFFFFPPVTAKFLPSQHPRVFFP